MTVLAGELLREAEKLVAQRIHPMIIADGAWRPWRVALAAAGPTVAKCLWQSHVAVRVSLHRG